jgi:sec-independent protein translocase protein TatA
MTSLDFLSLRCHSGLETIIGGFCMLGMGVPELIIVLIIVLVVFGPGRLPEIGGAIGKSIRNFKKASEGKDEIEIKPKKDEPKN